MEKWDKMQSILAGAHAIAKKKWTGQITLLKRPENPFACFAGPKHSRKGMMEQLDAKETTRWKLSSQGSQTCLGITYFTLRYTQAARFYF